LKAHIERLISAGWGYLAGLVGLAAAVVTVVLAFN
jgi:hypothetical protein